ncbi:MAG: hypothetical protein COB93_01665 [Sneathiella sp.]|nr:MAG: hypothetical protein COB93_01665 [Sneathiella sp.]
MKIFTFAALAVVATLSVGCAAEKKEKQTYKEASANEKKPVNCATAPGDLRVLQSEKVHTGKQIVDGVKAILPIGLVVGVLTRTEGQHIKIASGDYNKKLDEKIAEIKKTCNVQS